MNQILLRGNNRCFDRFIPNIFITKKSFLSIIIIALPFNYYICQYTRIFKGVRIIFSKIWPSPYSTYLRYIESEFGMAIGKVNQNVIVISREKMAQRTNSIQWRVTLPSAIIFYENIFQVKALNSIYCYLFILKKKKTNNRKYDVKCCNDTKPICLFTIFGWFIKK